MRWQWWMSAIVAAAILTLLITLRWVWVLRRKSREDDNRGVTEDVVAGD